MTQITQNAQLRRDVRFIVHPRPHEISAAYGAISTEGHLYDGQPYADQTVCRMASCNGKSGEVSHRIVTLLNTYGLVPNQLDLAITAGDYQVWSLDPEDQVTWTPDSIDYESLPAAQERARRLREAGHRARVCVVAVIEDH